VFHLEVIQGVKLCFEVCSLCLLSLCWWAVSHTVAMSCVCSVIGKCWHENAPGRQVIAVVISVQSSMLRIMLYVPDGALVVAAAATVVSVAGQVPASLPAASLTHGVCCCGVCCCLHRLLYCLSVPGIYPEHKQLDTKIEGWRLEGVRCLASTGERVGNLPEYGLGVFRDQVLIRCGQWSGIKK